MIDSEASRVAAIGKIPLGPRARHAIIHEVEILTRLEKDRPGLAPRTLFVDSTTGIAAQEFLVGKPTGRRLTEAHLAWLFDLEIPGETISLREVAEGLAQEISKLNGLDQGRHGALNRVVTEIDDPSPLRATWVHGDLAPWNLKHAPGQTLVAIDWEHASPKGLPLFDLIYYRSMQAFIFQEKELFPRSMQSLLRRAMDYFDIGPTIFRKIVLACLAQDWLRGHQEGDLARASYLFRHLREGLGQGI